MKRTREESSLAALPDVPVPDLESKTTEEKKGPQVDLRVLNAISPIIPKCTKCKTNEYVIEDAAHGFQVCTACGYQVGGQLMSEGAEWRTFADDTGPDPSRVGGKDDELFGFGTIIPDGGELTRAQTKTAYTPEQRKLEAVVKVIKNICRTLQVTNAVVTQASWIAHVVIQSYDEARVRNIKVDALASACVFHACKLTKQQHTKAEVIACEFVEEKQFNRQYKVVVEALKQKVNDMGSMALKRIKQTADASALQSEAIAFVDRYCNRMEFPLQIAHASKALLSAASNLDLATSHRDAHRAAAAIYLCAFLKNLKPSIDKIAALAIAQGDTIMKIVHKFYEVRKQIVPPDFVDPVALDLAPKP